MQDRAQVKARCLPMAYSLGSVNHLGMADCVFQAAESEFSEQLAHFLGNKQHEVLYKFRLAREPLTQHWVLSSDANRASIKVTHAHHDAARNHERGSSKTKLFCAKQRRNHDVPASLHLTICLHHNPVTQAVQHQRLLGLG